MDDARSLGRRWADRFVSAVIIAIILAIISAIAVPNFTESQIRVKVSQWTNAAGHITAGLISYQREYGALPVAGPPVSTHRFRKKDLPPTYDRLTTLADADQLSTAAIIYYDPFTPKPLGSHAPHLYFLSEDESDFVLISAGPDRDYDFDPALYLAPDGREEPSRLLPIIYDPSNGTISDGDLFHSREGYLRDLFAKKNALKQPQSDQLSIEVAH